MKNNFVRVMYHATGEKVNHRQATFDTPVQASYFIQKMIENNKPAAEIYYIVDGVHYVDSIW